MDGFRNPFGQVALVPPSLILPTIISVVDVIFARIVTVEFAEPMNSATGLLVADWRENNTIADTTLTGCSWFDSKHLQITSMAITPGDLVSLDWLALTGTLEEVTGFSYNPFNIPWIPAAAKSGGVDYGKTPFALAAIKKADELAGVVSK